MTTSQPSKTLWQLRRLAGLRLEDVADLARLPRHVVSAAEGDGPGHASSAQLAGVFGVDAGAWRTHGRVMAGAEDNDTSVFLFSGDLTSFVADDAGSLAQALDYARTWVDGEGAAGLRNRLSHRPVAAAGPRPTDAALQGYLLARHVRASLGLLTEPVGDIRELAETKLGAVILVARLSTKNLGACAILDTERSGAAIVLDHRLGRRRRVAVAHELCHLLFDPSGPGMVAITLDSAAVVQHSHDLREARARGFAAELLLPLAGLRALFGPVEPATDAELAADRVQEACAQFGTTWEIAANHLYNMRLISRAAWEDVRFAPKDGLVPLPDTSLPKQGEPPLCLNQDLVSGLSSWDLAGSARRTARTAVQSIEDERASKARAAVVAFQEDSESAPMRAGVELSKWLDRAFSSGDPRLVEYALHLLNPRRVNGDAMVMALSSARHGCFAHGSPLLDEYRTAVARLLDALPSQWDWSEEEVADARETLL